MKTKIFTLCFALVASVGTMFAESGTCGANLTWSLNKSSGLLTISGTGPMTSFGYPGEVPWHADAGYITSVNMSNGVTSIGRFAFEGCTGLTSIEIPNSVTSIGYNAVSGCFALTSVTIPNSVTSIGERAFYGCLGLTSVTFGNNVTSIGDYAFFCCGLTSVTIPSKVTSIGNYAFDSCLKLTSVTIPNSVTSIGDRAFSVCGLTSVTIPNSVTSIGERAFYYCESLTSINVASDNTTYDSRNNCNAIIETSSNKLISGCMNTTIPNSVTNIGFAAFSGCSKLTSITIPNSVTSIGNYAFAECTGLTSIEIPNSVTSIGNKAFYHCKSLTSIEIPNSVTSIGNYAFAECTGLTSINVASDNTTYDSRNNCNAIIETSSNKLISGIKNTVIPNSVTSIGNYAFVYCYNLTSIEIPNSVMSIGDSAFFCCDLTSVTIPSKVTSIGDYAFYCGDLENITCQATNPPSMGVDVFTSVVCSKIPLYVPVGRVNTYKSAKQWKNFTNILPIAAKDAETNTIKAEPTPTSVEVTWPVVAGAYTYELVIKDKSGNVVCTLVFNAQGQLQSIVFAAPSRDGAPQHKQEAGFSFTITGLTKGTSYDVIITAKDNGGYTLDTKIVSFTTEVDTPTGINDINAATKSQKIVRDNQVLILRGEKTYTVTGQEIK